MPNTVKTRYSPAVLEGIAAGERVVLRLTLARGDLSAVSDAAATALARAEELMAVAREREPPIRPIACKKGCSACCVAKVLVSPAEAVRIAEYIKKKLSAAELNALIKSVEDARARSHGLTRKERIQKAIACPLLDSDGGCLVHEVRPIICAGWNSIDKAGCDAHFIEHTADMPPEMHPQSNEVALAVLGGLIGAAIDRKLDTRPLELHAALQIALGDEHCGERWRRGESVFEAAIDREVSPY
ncbi:MAG: YkgJ family cysteine cluster protein [Polyangiaceae bacterium]|nr:YkgJ family cysteine cluster protein [Polyangiaceae bacterium]